MTPIPPVARPTDAALSNLFRRLAVDVDYLAQKMPPRSEARGKGCDLAAEARDAADAIEASDTTQQVPPETHPSFVDRVGQVSNDRQVIGALIQYSRNASTFSRSAVVAEVLRAVLRVRL